MKIFWPVLAAILVAAVLIGLFIGIKSHFDALEARQAAIKAETIARGAKLNQEAEIEIQRERKREQDKINHDKMEAAVTKAVLKKHEKEREDLHKAGIDVPEPVYPTLEEAFASPTPEP